MSGLQSPLPAILWGRADNEEADSFQIGFYEREELPTSDPVRLVEADGVDFLVIQDWICDELEGKVIDVIDGKLTVGPREQGR
jgi:hypothetical protein